MKEQRYVVKIEAYVYAQDAAHAQLKSREYCKTINKMEDGIRAEFTEIYEAPFGEINLHPTRVY